MTDYQGPAINNYSALLKQCGSTSPASSFWRIGNTFDTMMDYIATIYPNTADQLVQAVVAQYELGLTKIDGGIDGAWFDDFGWWSAATLRALRWFGSRPQPKLQVIFDQCWPRYMANAPFVWERRGSSKFDKYRPAVDGGVWNAYWDGTPPQWKGPKNGNPSDGHLIGIQNTVTNALYLMTAHRAGRTDPNSRKAAESEQKFLFTWFEEAEDPLWWKIDANSGLVLERVGHFANGVKAPFSPGPCPAPCKGFHTDWAWSGDQGLILGCLVDIINATAPNFRGPLITRARELIAGVGKNMTDKGVVQPWTASGCVPDCDMGDYGTGPGVYWRNILYAWNNAPDLQPDFKHANFRTILKASADAVVNAPTDPTKVPFDTLSNQLSVLLAAYKIL
jgi:hypothetical protein